jgi:hypothetical protein
MIKRLSRTLETVLTSLNNFNSLVIEPLQVGYLGQRGWEIRPLKYVGKNTFKKKI